MKSVIVFLKNVWNAQENAGFAQFYRDKCAQLSSENAAIRSQISQRDASGRFVKKNAS